MKILMYPLGENPYQKLLIESLKNRKKITITSFNNTQLDKHGFILGIISFPFRLLNYRARGYKIFHLHWISPFIIHNNKFYLNKISIIYIILFILTLKLLKYKIVWTMHNLKSHEGKFIYDNFANKFLSRTVDIKIIHSEQNLHEMRKLNLSIKNTYVIPHGNYINFYKNKITKKEARIILGINKNDFVFLFIGRIEQYKGIEDLLKAFSKLKYPRSKLIIAGKCQDEHLLQVINTYKNDPRILIYNNFIPDNNIQIYINASDIITHPFKQITTSGSAILSLSFGKPIIYPTIGSLKDFPKNIGLSYNPNDKTGLIKCLEKAVKDKEELTNMGQNGYVFARNFSWDKIGDKTYDLYKKLTS